MRNTASVENIGLALDQTPLPKSLGFQLDRKAILVRLQGDEELFRDLVNLFAADTPQLICEARHALACGDANTLQRAAHTIKGSVSNFGAEPAVEAAWRLEQLGQSGNLSEGPGALKSMEAALSAVECELYRIIPC
jgi:two-component system, sensor histidine kinase and response regulator